MIIDFHAHILPGADHGSECLETSMRQLALAQEAGVDTVIATPHFYPQIDRLETFLARRERTYQLLNEANCSQRPKILLGAEVQICVGLDHMEGLDKLCIEGTKVILLELPFSGWSKGVDETLMRIQEESGLTPVLAHVDRYAPLKIESFFERGVLGQLNAAALCKLSGKRLLCKWIDEEHIVALGSDIHGTQIGYSQFQKATKYLGKRTDTIMRRTTKLIGKKALLI